MSKIIFITSTILIAVLWGIFSYNRIHFFNVNVEIFIALSILLLIIQNIFNLKFLPVSPVISNIIIHLSIVIVPFLFNSHEFTKFKNFQYYVWGDITYSNHYGGKPTCVLIYGEIYFNGIFKQEIGKFDYDCFKSNLDTSKYKIPEGVDVEFCVFQKSTRLLFDLKTEHVFRIDKR